MTMFRTTVRSAMLLALSGCIITPDRGDHRGDYDRHDDHGDHGGNDHHEDQDHLR